MNKPLTHIAIDKLKPGPDRYEKPDGAQRGLYVVVFPSGQKSFVVRYRFAGIKRKLTLGGVSLEAARKAAAAALFDVHEGRDPALAKQAAKAKASESAADTVKALCENFLKREGIKLRTVADRRRDLERLVYPVIGRIPVNTLRRSQIVKMLDGIEDENGTRTADLCLSYLSRVFNWHAARSDSFRSPIAKGMRRYSAKANARSRVLTDDEIRALWRMTDSTLPHHAAFRFLLLTGARKSEAAGLAWSEIEDDLWTLPPERNKTKVELVRPLSKAAMQIIADQPVIEGARFVFGSGKVPVSLHWAKSGLDREGKIKDGWVIHDLRRTFRTLASRAGVSADHAERCLGHAINGVRGVYDRHAFQAEMLHAFEAVAALVGNIINPDDRVVPMKRKRAH